MNRDKQQTTRIGGEVTHVFAHRFVVKTATGHTLADIGPKGADQIRVTPGDRVELSGDMKPSELKVSGIALNGAPSIEIEHHKERHTRETDVDDPRAAVKRVEANGVVVLGDPLRKPKHYEMLARDAAGALVELHVELDGILRKTRPADTLDPKWAAHIASRS